MTQSATGSSSDGATTRSQPTESASPFRLASGRPEPIRATRCTAGGIRPLPNSPASNYPSNDVPASNYQCVHNA